MSGCDVCIGIDDYDPADFYSDKMRTARKQHRCCECGRVIEVGEHYQHVAGAWDRKVSTYKTCQQCKEIRESFACGEGFLFTTLWDDMQEYAFPVMTLSSECFTQLTAKAKEFCLAKWREWKGLTR